jgi:hypothetical protein
LIQCTIKCSVNHLFGNFNLKLCQEVVVSLQMQRNIKLMQLYRNVRCNN